MSAFEFVFMNVFCAGVSLWLKKSFAWVLLNYLIVGKITHKIIKK